MQLFEEATPEGQVQTVSRDGLTYRRYSLEGCVVEAALTPRNCHLRGYWQDCRQSHSAYRP